MRTAYADTSVLLAVALRESGFEGVAANLAHFDVVFSSNLLEAEFRSALHREDVNGDLSGYLREIKWFLPDRALSDELDEVLQAGTLRGADCWHVACALYLSRKMGALEFLSLDRHQSGVAAKLGLAS